MNRIELIESIATKAEITKKDAEKALAAFMDTVKDTLASGDKIALVGFGTFEVTERAAREGRNPKTGETMHISESKSPKFKAGKSLKDFVNA